MSQLLWIIDPDPTSAQALRSAIDLLGPEVETYDHIPAAENPPKAVLIAGPAGPESLQKWVGELRRMGGNDLLPITLIGGLKNSAEALALGADHYLDAPLVIADLWDHLRGFLTLSPPNDPEREIPLSRGVVDSTQTEQSPTKGETPEHEDPMELGTSTEHEPVDAFAETQEDIEAAAPQSDAETQDLYTHNTDELSVAPLDDYRHEDSKTEESTQNEPLAAGSDERAQTPDEISSTEDDFEPSTTTTDHDFIESPEDTPSTKTQIKSDQNTEPLSIEPVADHDTPEAFETNESTEQYSEQILTQPDVSGIETNEFESPSEDLKTTELFGLKQPKEIEEMSEKSENKPIQTLEWAEERQSEELDFNADSAWGLDEREALNEPNTTGWDEPETTASEAWDQDENNDSNWGESDASWGDETSGSNGWGAETQNDDSWGGSNSWSSSSSPEQKSSKLSQLGQQLMPPELKPRAPVSPLGQLHATGLLGLLARCGQERVSGRVTWRHDSESVILHLHDGRLKALDSALFDQDLLQAALAQGWIDTQELTGVEHLMQRRHTSAASVLAREGIKSSDAIQQLAQETAERILLRCSNLPGGYAQFHPEMDFEQAVAVSQTDTTSRLIALCESLVESSLWTALVGGDDAVPTLHSVALPQHLPGREALHAADGARSLLELATSHGVAIRDIRSGCLAALVLGQIELTKVGVSSIQHSHRPDQTFERALKQIRSGNYFTVLGLPEAHSASEVHRAFAARVSLLRSHLHANHPRFAEAYQELEEARDVLLDPDLRAQYRSANPQTLER